MAGLGGGVDGVAQAAVVARVPRTVLALLVGAALALSGATMQAVTRNPLADPGILGVSGGAALAVVIGIAFFGMSDPYPFLAVAVAGAAIVMVFTLSLMIGQTFYGLDEVVRVIAGETVPGASFTVGELRLPRSVLAILAGFSFGIAGVTFQTMLRNPLASPDIIGITSGASAAAVFGIVVLYGVPLIGSVQAL